MIAKNLLVHLKVIVDETDFLFFSSYLEQIQELMTANFFVKES